ncbi:retrovirus-related Pol polyprotein from transposon 17.6 [Trichonephila clavipes]|nr:retrovirus-related Pol polyprotein from transposon 17.6 [Trichonephila clavipes]
MKRPPTELTLKKTERNYSTTERECLAFVWAVTKFRPYILERHFEIVADHYSLCWLTGLKDPSGRLARWALRLQYDLDIVYKSGKKYKDANSLSRNPVENEVFPSEQKSLASFSDIAEGQRKDPKLSKLIHTHEKAEPVTKTSAPFQRIGIDLLGRFPRSTKGNKWIIVCTDYLPRLVVTKALPTAEPEEVVKFITEEIVLKHGAPLRVEAGQLCSSKHRKTTGYHTNGLTERFNKTLEDMLSMYVNVEQTNWDEILPFVTFAYNTAKQETTGYTPFYLFHGREAETILDIVSLYSADGSEDDYVSRLITRAEKSRQLARIRTLEAQHRDKTRYDTRHRSVSYRPGKLVWVFTPVRKVSLSEKLLKRYFGPYRVVRKLSDVTYEVEELEPSPRRRKSTQVVHILRMKKYFTPEAQERILTNDTENLLSNAPAVATYNIGRDKRYTTLDSSGYLYLIEDL